jgi:hypothetical protein
MEYSPAAVKQEQRRASAVSGFEEPRMQADRKRNLWTDEIEQISNLART